MDATVTGNVSKNSTCRVSAAPFAEVSPMPMAAVNAASHILCYVKLPPFGPLVDKPKEDLIGNSLTSVVAALNACRGDSARVVVGLTLQSRRENDSDEKTTNALTKWKPTFCAAFKRSTKSANVRKPGDAPVLRLSVLVPLLQATRHCSALALAVAARVATATWTRHASEPGVMAVKRVAREPRLRDCTFVTPL